MGQHCGVFPFLPVYPHLGCGVAGASHLEHAPWRPLWARRSKRDHGVCNVDVPRGCSTIVGRQTRHCAPTLCKEVTAATPARLPFPNGCRRDTVRITHRWTGQSRRRGTCVQHPDFEGTETRVSMMIRHAANGGFAAGGRESKPSRCSHFAAPVKCTRASTQLRRSLSTLR